MNETELTQMQYLLKDVLDEVSRLRELLKTMSFNDQSGFKEDLLKMVNMVESAAQTGYSSMNSHYNFYLSLLTIDSSSCFVKVNEQIVSHFFVNLIEPITISNPTLCNLHKRWLDSMRKHSTLITQSNEIEQVRYFGKQKKAIEMISNTTNGHAL